MYAMSPSVLSTEMLWFLKICTIPAYRPLHHQSPGNRLKEAIRRTYRGCVRTYSGQMPASAGVAYTTVSHSKKSKTRSRSNMSQKAVKKEPAIPRPSSSIILVSPTNEILLLHRVQTSSSFASAHVFPGGNLSSQDGECPSPRDLKRHDDAIYYRRAAIRELFEESGILLAKDQSTSQMIHVTEAERERGRRAIHRNEITFQRWLQGQNSAAEPDINALIPFTHWITPPNLPKRYTTQMYLYFLPVLKHSEKQIAQGLPAEGVQEVQIPISDGGVEIMEARFLPACDWLRKARSGEIILFPPQFLLLHIISQFLDQAPRQGISSEQLNRRRSELLEFVHSGNPPWTDKYICPKSMKLLSDKRAVLALDSPGPELQGSEKKGESDLVVLVRFSKEGARDLDVRLKKDILWAGDKSNL